MSRYGNNIRRIAQTDEILKRILQAEQNTALLDKVAIPGGRSIAYPTSGTQSGSPGTTNANNFGSPVARKPNYKDVTDQAGLDGNSTSGASIINGSTKLQEGDDPGAIELKDCDTGEEINVLMSSGSIEGEAKFQHPEGWDIDGPKGVLPGWENWVLGQYWNNPNGVSAPTLELLANIIIGTSTGAFTITSVRNIVATYAPNGLSGYVQYDAYYQSNSDPTAGSWIATSTGGSAVGCGSETGTGRCPTSAPPAYNSWQEQDSDYKHQLAFSAQDGGFVSSSYDEGLPAKFRNDVGGGKGMNNLRLCTSDGTEVVMSALRDGTFAFFQEDGFGNPEAGAKIFHFDSAGKYKDVIRPDQYDYLKSTNN